MANEDLKQKAAECDKWKSLAGEMKEALEYYYALDNGQNPKKLPPGAKIPFAQVVLAKFKAHEAGL